MHVTVCGEPTKDCSAYWLDIAAQWRLLDQILNECTVFGSYACNRATSPDARSEVRHVHNGQGQVVLVGDSAGCEISAPMACSLESLGASLTVYDINDGGIRLSNSRATDLATCK